MPETPPLTPSERTATLQRIQRFLNRWRDAIGHPAPLTPHGELDEATCEALRLAVPATQGSGRFALPDAQDATDAQLRAFSQKINGYHRDVGNTLARGLGPMSAEKRTAWWSAVQQTLHDAGAAVPESPALSPEAITAATVQYLTHHLPDPVANDQRRAAAGWAYRYRRHLPPPMEASLLRGLPVRPEMENAGALVNSSFPVVPGLNGRIVTYSFAHPVRGDSEQRESRTPEPMSDASKQRFRQSLAEIEQFANIRFIEMPDEARVDYQVFVDDQRAREAKPTYSGTVPPRTPPRQRIVVFNAATGQRFDRPDEHLTVMIHEALHMANLQHTQTEHRDCKGRISKPSLAEPLDNLDNSVMSYFHMSSQPKADSPMVLDVMALQRLYGTNNDTRRGNSLYHVADGFTGKDKIRRTLYDAAGYDAIDARTAKGDAILDLRPGYQSPSDIDGHELWIAPGTHIEAALGGAGNDALIAGEGGSYLKGGAGEDTFRILGNGHHVVGDFEASERLELSVRQAKAGVNWRAVPGGIRVESASTNHQPAFVLDIQGTDRAAIVAALEKAVPKGALHKAAAVGSQAPVPHLPTFTEEIALAPNALPVSKPRSPAPKRR